jgi:hypothetical protein
MKVEGRSGAAAFISQPAIARLGRMKAHDMKMFDTPARETCFGFAGPENEVMSLTIPAANEDGRGHSFNSFDIEYDPEQPDMLRICLLETDHDNFIHAIRKSTPFPARLLAELLSRRSATATEVAAWQTPSGEDE